MSVEIEYKNNKYNTDCIVWDRDSYFIDFSNYWEKLVGSISQQIAEKTTTNWDLFNVVRNTSIKALGINPENAEILSGAAISFFPILSTNVLIANQITPALKDKTNEELQILIKSIIKNILLENLTNIKSAANLKEINFMKEKKFKTKNILITNDSCENNNRFLKESGLENFFTEVYSNINKEDILGKIKQNFVFITKNSYLSKAYLSAGCKNILLVENIFELSFEPKYNTDSMTVYIDGASRGNPGHSSVGIVIYNGDNLVKEISEYIGEKTNNYAEYTALIKALEYCIDENYKKIEIKSDSELVVKQIKNEYKVKDVDLKQLFEMSKLLIDKFENFKITHVKREENKKADKLANEALNNRV